MVWHHLRPDVPQVLQGLGLHKTLRHVVDLLDPGELVPHKDVAGGVELGGEAPGPLRLLVAPQLPILKPGSILKNAEKIDVMSKNMLKKLDIRQFFGHDSVNFRIF